RSGVEREERGAGFLMMANHSFKEEMFKKGSSESTKTVRAEPVEARDVAGDVLRQACPERSRRAQGDRICSALPKRS
ncbi:MAG: hypothetical protein ACK5JI_05930, partial [Azonexus sp.]